MFKKALKIVTTFGLLVAAYAVYVNGFALVVAFFGLGRSAALTFEPVDSASKQKASEYAVRAFKPGHWSSNKDLEIRLYNAERGFWMYATSYKIQANGKQIELTPFALIWLSPDAKVLKTIEGDRALIDLDQPVMSNKPGVEPMKVVHAKIEDNVKLRDDKGTPDRNDDLRISMNYVEYDEPTLKIYTESPVVIVDRDMRVDGNILQINLREKPPGQPGGSAGFNGAKNAFLRKNVHIVINDVGSTGILPGASTPAQRAGDKTPLDLRCDGEMQIDLPEPTPEVVVGPPEPQGPTFVQFDRNVEVLRGKPGVVPDKRDKLTCDHLHLTLVPAADKPDAPKAETVVDAKAQGVKPGPGDAQDKPTAEESGPLTDLTLRRAHATGHNVWVESAAQGVDARCNQLIHEKHLPEGPDFTYLRGDATTKLIVNKRDVAQAGPNKGQVTSYTQIRTIDATIEDRGEGNDFLTIRARGPGILETSPGLNKPVEQTARWLDSLVVQTERAPLPPRKAKLRAQNADGTKAEPDKEVLKRITLTRNASFSDTPSKTDLTAIDTIIVWLRPKEKKAEPVTVAAPTAGAGATGSSDSMEIEKLLALEDVHLTAPSKTLIARDRLDAEFMTLAAEPPKILATTSGPSPVASRPATATAPATASTSPAPKPATTPAPAKPAEPASKAVANRVYAGLVLHPKPEGETTNADAAGSTSLGRGSTGRTEIEVANLRGAVIYHQDKEPGKERGTDVTGEAVDILRVEDRGASRRAADAEKALYQFIVLNWNPDATKSGGKSLRVATDDADFTPLARVATDEMTILGAVIGLNQASDFAWVNGLGSMTQMTENGLFSDKDKSKALPADDVARAEAKKNARPGAPAAPRPKKHPMTITFTQAMRFYGRPTRPDSIAARHDFVLKKFTDRDVASEEWPAARAEFYQNVHVDTKDTSVDCRDNMMVYLDRPVSLARGMGKGDASPVPSLAVRPAPAADDDDTNGSREPRGDKDQDKADVALVECVEKVLVTNLKHDPVNLDSTGELAVVERQDIEGEYLVYDKATGNFRVPGAGQVFLVQREGAKGLSDPGARPRTNPAGNGNGAGTRSSSARPAIPVRPVSFQDDSVPVVGRTDTSRSRALPNDLTGDRGGAGSPRQSLPQPKSKVQAKTKAKAKSKSADPPTLPPLILTQVKFTREMIGRFGSGKESDKGETRWADFFGNVESIHAKVDKDDDRLDFDRPPVEHESLAAKVVRVVSMPVLGEPDAQPHNFLTAWDNAYARSGKRTIQADRITYDSFKQLFYAYGEEGRDALIQEQEFYGIAPKSSRAKTLRYNQKTGEVDLTEPKSFAIFDPKTGSRPTPAPVDPGAKPPVRKKKPFQNNRMSIERKDFNGH